MFKKNLHAYKYFNLQKNLNRYTNIYKKENFEKDYPANKYRLLLVKKIIKNYKIKSILDVGCGTGQPMVSFLKDGYNIHGYDKAINMIELGKKNLLKNKFKPERIFFDNMDKPKNVDKKFDCIIGLGSFYYANNMISSLKNNLKYLKKGGLIVFSLRNMLFNISTFNNYSKKFFEDLYKIKNYNPKYKKKFQKFFKGYQKKNDYNIDKARVKSIVNNPLNIHDEIIKKTGIKLINLHYYHNHALPPCFEKFNKNFFRIKSSKMELKNNWKSIFLSSAFIVEAKK